MSERVHRVDGLSFVADTMLLRVDGTEYAIDIPAHSRRLAMATAAQRAHYDISPSGYGIHWPDIDEDLAVDALIGRWHDVPSGCTQAVA
jgi:hypothetical protein